MATSAAVRHRLGGCAMDGGFTLVEMLVAMIVLGISASLVAVNFSPHPRSVLESEARRLAMLLQAARDEAVATGRGIAWAPDAGGYAFSRQPSTARSAAFGNESDKDIAGWERRWPAGVSLSSVEFSVGGRAALRDAWLLFTASGINTPFTVVLSSGPWRIALSGDLLGSVRIAQATQGSMP